MDFFSPAFAVERIDSSSALSRYNVRDLSATVRFERSCNFSAAAIELSSVSYLSFAYARPEYTDPVSESSGVVV